MLDAATSIAALAVLVFLFVAVLTVLAMVLRGAVFVCNRITPDTTLVPVPSIGRATAITVMSTFVNGVFLIGFGSAASFLPGTLLAPILALLGVADGTFVMAQIVSDILPSSLGRALAIMFAATVCQLVMFSISWTQLGLISGMMWTIMIG